MSSGKVWLRAFRPTVSLAMVPDMPETTMFDGKGEAGAPVDIPVPLPGITSDVALVNVTAGKGLPRRRLYAIVPRLVAPSCSCNVRVMLVPQVPVAVKVNA